jgi:hypothetical protein
MPCRLAWGLESRGAPGKLPSIPIRCDGAEGGSCLRSEPESTGHVLGLVRKMGEGQVFRSDKPTKIIPLCHLFN